MLKTKSRENLQSKFFSKLWPFVGLEIRRYNK